MATNFALQGQQAADSQSYIGWLVFGGLLGLVGPDIRPPDGAGTPVRRTHTGSH